MFHLNYIKAFFLLWLIILSSSSFCQVRKFSASVDTAVPMGNFTNLATTGVGVAASYKIGFTYLEAGYLNFGEKKIQIGSNWISSKVSMINLRIGRKLVIHNFNEQKSIAILPEIGSTISYLVGNSNIGLGTDTNETDFSYGVGLGYSTKIFEFKYSVQFIRLSGSTNASTPASSTTLEYSSFKIGWRF